MDWMKVALKHAESTLENARRVSVIKDEAEAKAKAEADDANRTFSELTTLVRQLRDVLRDYTTDEVKP